MIRRFAWRRDAWVDRLQEGGHAGPESGEPHVQAILAMDAGFCASRAWRHNAPRNTFPARRKAVEQKIAQDCLDLARHSAEHDRTPKITNSQT